MILLPAARFLMGSQDFYPDEAPVRAEEVGAFWIDETPVTNAQFARFVDATGHVTAAEAPPDPSLYPAMPTETVGAGSCVFRDRMWQFVVGADWRHPTGPDSDLSGLDDHPVVHVVSSDAEAYARWAGKALPGEAEWEYAARGGLLSKPFAWGDEFMPDGRIMARTWQGTFPLHHTAPPDQQRTAAVRSYPPNGFGLHDMIGNVSEWCEDTYDAKLYGRRSGMTSDPWQSSGSEYRVLRGGSWYYFPSFARSADRSSFTPGSRLGSTGFRVVCASVANPR